MCDLLVLVHDNDVLEYTDGVFGVRLVIPNDIKENKGWMKIIMRDAKYAIFKEHAKVLGYDR